MLERTTRVHRRTGSSKPMMNTKYLAGGDHKKSEVRLEYTKGGYQVSGWRGPLEYTGELAGVYHRWIPSNSGPLEYAGEMARVYQRYIPSIWLERTTEVYYGTGTRIPQMDTKYLAGADH